MALNLYSQPNIFSSAGVKPFGNNFFGASDDKSFDRVLGQRVLTPMAADFGVNPGFGYYNESMMGASPNAYANPLTRVPSTRGTMAFGLQLLRMMLARERGEYAIMALCAHEFAHIKQFEKGIQNVLLSRYGAKTGKRLAELQADFVAGYYVGDTFSKSIRDTQLQQALSVISTRWAEMGSGTAADPGPHGTSAQRVKAIEGGYQYASKTLNPNIDESLDRGLRHVLALG